MKALLTLSVLLFAQIGYCQSKGDSKIVVPVADTSGLFNKISLFLIDRGYSLEQKDRELGYIRTYPKKLGKWQGEIRILVRLENSNLTFTGFADVSGRLGLDGLKSSGTFDPVAYVGKNNLLRNCWDELEIIAKAFGDVQYSH